VGDLRPGEPDEKGERRVDREPDDYGELPARGHDVVLRRPRPPDKCLGYSLARAHAAERSAGDCARTCAAGASSSERGLDECIPGAIRQKQAAAHPCLVMGRRPPSVTLSGVRTAVVLYLAGLAVLVVGLSSILFAGWLAALLVIAGIAIFCAGIAAEERGYKE
jgi:hypothetical protein